MTKPHSNRKFPTKSSDGRGRRTAQAAWRDQSGAGQPRSSGIALWRQITEDIELDIETGRLAPGQQLPTETALAEQYGVNRHTLRRAIGELTQKGLVAATAGRGTFVREPRLAYPIGPSTRFSEVITGTGREPGGRLLSQGRVPVPEGVRAWLGLSAGADVIEIEHLRVANDMPICLATAWFPAQRFDGIAATFADTGTITAALAKFGVRDYRRLKTLISCRAANSAERDALQLERGAMVLVNDSINVDADGVPIQASHTRFAASRVQLVFENTD